VENELDRAIVTHDNTFLIAVLADEYQYTNYLGGTTDKKGELDFFTCRVRVYTNVAIAIGT